MKTLQQVVAEFMVADEVASKSSSTRRRHVIILNKLMEVCGPTMPVARLGRTHIDVTIAQWRGLVLPNTLNGYRSTLRVFGRWVHEIGYTKTNAAAHLRTEKTVVAPSKREPVEGNKVADLLRVAGERHPRDFMSVFVLLATGLRGGEAVGLRWRDADFEGRRFLVYRSKVNDIHEVPWSDQLADALVTWKGLYVDRHGEIKPEWYLLPALAYRSEHPDPAFRMHVGWPMVPTKPQSRLGTRVKGFLRQIGVTELEGKGAHSLRRTAANMLLDSGAEVRDVQTLLGHSSIAMTELYLNRNTARDKLRDRVKDWKI